VIAMQLEKATSHSSEAGLAGWISSNDVTLFTVVLVVGIAIFLQANLLKRSRTNELLEGENLSLSDRNRRVQEELDRIAARLDDKMAELDQARLELDDRNRQLASIRAQRDETQRQRDDLKRSLDETEQQLAAKREAIDQLNAALAALQLERDNLFSDKEQLTKAKSDLAEENEGLAETKADLEQGLAELTAKLTQRLQELDGLQKQRDLLEQKAQALAERVQRLEQQLGGSESSLAELQKTSGAEIEDLKSLLARALERHKSDQTASAEQLQVTVTRAEQAEAQAKQVTARANDYLDRLRRAAVYVHDINEDKRLLQLQVDALKTQLANVLDDLKTVQDQLQHQEAREKTINRELVGLRGNLRRVAILFDSSGSMSQSGRWEEVQRIAGTWLDHLDVDECVLMVFASDVSTYPPSGAMLRVSGAEGDENRRRLADYLKSVKPEGWTNTLAAMRKAYAYPGLDTIILFSDGAPTYEDSSRFNAEAAQEIYALCRQHSQIPINAIGLGNYFDQELSTFLRTLAQLTGGTFVGR
jgi:chromosome segregation ATPase